jgi:hypothetical protein
MAAARRGRARGWPMSAYVAGTARISAWPIRRRMAGRIGRAGMSPVVNHRASLVSTWSPPGWNTMGNAERLRLDEADAGWVPRRRRGLHLSERHWGNGAGTGASRRTGCTGTTGLLPLLFWGVKNEGLSAGGRSAATSVAAGQRMGAAR